MTHDPVTPHLTVFTYLLGIILGIIRSSTCYFGLIHPSAYELPYYPPLYGNLAVFCREMLEVSRVWCYPVTVCLQIT
jgi:hypothetical protein